MMGVDDASLVEWTGRLYCGGLRAHDVRGM